MNITFVDGEVAGLLRIAGEVAELAHDLNVRRTHILDRLLSLIGGCWAVCSEIDPSRSNISGWAVPSSITCAGRLSSYQQNVIDCYLTGRLGAVDPCIPYLLREQKPVVTLRRTDVIGDAWYQSDHFNKVRLPLGFGESLYSLVTTPNGSRLKLSLHREMNDPPFSERHVRLLHVFNENLGGLYVAPRSAATPAMKPDRQPTDPVPLLPPRLRPVLQRLLAGDAEKQAALKLGLSRHTVHEYTKALYRTFRVSSRGELLAKFVANPPAGINATL